MPRTTMVSDADTWLHPLLDDQALSQDDAVALARHMAAIDPMLDVRLLRRTRGVGPIGAVKSSQAQRVLNIVDAISTCSRLSAHLIQFLQHPDPGVRSKAALLVGRANLNLGRVRSFLHSGDGRLAANAVESLWSHDSLALRAVLWEAAHDPRGRVAVNALVGLHRLGEKEAGVRLIKLAKSADPAARAGAAWGMGKTQDPQFKPILEKLESDHDEKVRAAAAKARQACPVAKPAR